MINVITTNAKSEGGVALQPGEGWGNAGLSPSARATCFGQPAGAPGAGRAVAPGQHRHAAQAGRPGHGGPQAAARAVGVGAAPGPLLLGPLEFGLRAALPAPARPRRAVSVAPGARPSEKRTGTALRSVSSGGQRGPSRESRLHETLLVNPFHRACCLPNSHRHPTGQAGDTSHVTCYTQEKSPWQCHGAPLPVKEKQLENQGVPCNRKLVFASRGKVQSPRRVSSEATFGTACGLE